MTVRPDKTQISRGIRAVWSESSLCAQWVAKEPSFLHADSEDSDQTGRMPRLIWVFAGRTDHFVCFVKRRLNLTFLLDIADSEDSDQTGRMPRLIGVFAGRTDRFVCFVMRQLSLTILLDIASYSIVVHARLLVVKWRRRLVYEKLKMKMYFLMYFRVIPHTANVLLIPFLHI